MMSSLKRTLAIFAAATSGAVAADLPPAMKNAIGRIAGGTGHSNNSFYYAQLGLTRKSAGPRQLIGAPDRLGDGAKCSVPLVEMRINDQDRYAMRIVKPRDAEPMPRTTGPAPACDHIP